MILGPLKLQPNPFPAPSKLSANTGALSVLERDIICQNKGGEIGNEMIACWYYIRDIFGDEVPITKEFEGVKTLDMATSNPRGFTFDCILSQNDIGDSDDITLTYERCRVQNSGEALITIEGDKVVGMGVTTFNAYSLNTARMIMPSPIQDALTTVIGSGCDTAWELVGHTNLEIRGDQINSGCNIVAQGEKTDSVLTVDFGLGTVGANCIQGYDIEVSAGRMIINGATLDYGSVFKTINLVMSDCDDTVRVTSTFGDAILVDIAAGGGDGEYHAHVTKSSLL